MRGSKSSSIINMTEGPMFFNIIKFILPLIATTMLQQLYHSADIITVGFSSEPDAVGAIGSTGLYLALIRNLFIGFSVGANVVVARYIGAKNDEGVSRAVHTSICMSLVFGIIGSVLGIAFSRIVLEAMGLTGKILTLALRYSYIFFSCMPFLSLTNFLSAILNAQGNTKTPLYVLSATGVLNVILNCIFIFAFNMSVEGVAIATAVSNIVSAVALWIYLVKKGGACTIFRNKLRITRSEFIEVARIGFPAGIQGSLFSISNLLIQSSIVEINNLLTPIGSAYEPVIKANAATGDIESFIFAALTPVTTAASAFVAQNVGAENYDRVKKALWDICIIGSVIAIVTSAFFVIFRDPIFSLYGIKNSSDVLSQIAYRTAETKVFYKWVAFLPFAIMNASSGAIRGMGKSTIATVITLLGTCAFRIAWIFTVYERFGTLESVYISYPISWLITGAIAFVIVLFLINKKIAKE